MAEILSGAGASGGSVFHWPVRVYYEDTDAGGVVYHASYLRFMERARTEHMRALGFGLDDIAQRHDTLFVVRGLQIEYLKPARFNDSLIVTVEIGDIRSASIYFNQTVLRDGKELLSEARVRVVSISAANFRPKPVPMFLLQACSGP